MLAELGTHPSIPALRAARPPGAAPRRGTGKGARCAPAAGNSSRTASAAAPVAAAAAAASAATAAAALAGAGRWATPRTCRGTRRRAARGRGARVVAAASVAEAAPPPTAEGTAAQAAPKARPLQIVKIDLESNQVVIGEEEIKHIEAALASTGVEKVAIVGVMGAFRTGKSFLLDFMLRYARGVSIERPGGAGAAAGQDEGCEVPRWVVDQQVPDWVFKCGSSMTEGRETPGMVAEEAEGFLWRPGMEKCTEGIWVWSEAFVMRSGNEDVAVLLMDTQGAWDAKMSKEQSATVFGLTTLMTSRLIYNVSKQIQQDKVDNLLYFVDFAQAALRTKEIRGLDASKGSAQPFQTLEFLVRDWPHYADGETVSRGRDMMLAHLDQYRDPKVSADTSSMDNLARMFGNIDVWCLPHPSLKIERESWDGKLDVIEPDFWRFLDDYMRKIFSPSELAVKTTMGTPVTVGSFGAVIRKFIAAFGVAAPQAQTFAEAMETSTSLLAAESAMKVLRAQMEAALPALGDEALAPEAFEERASAAAREAQQEFEDKAIFGDEAGISKRGSALKVQVSKELDRYREENQRRLEASLGGLTNVTVAAIAAFGADRFSDVACDWWLDLCRDLSGTLSTGYLLVAAYVAFSLNNVSSKQGGLSATVAAVELWKSVLKRGGELLSEAKAKADDPD